MSWQKKKALVSLFSNKPPLVRGTHSSLLSLNCHWN
nr:MAG TPA_asm: hypothetical protein [Bacteriophage sp.]